MAATWHHAGCCCAANPCEWCAGSTPKRLIVVASGITFCDCTNCNGPGSKDWTTLPVSPNGTHILVQQEANPCWWKKEIETVGVITRYSNDNCANAHSVLNVNKLLVQVLMQTNGLTAIWLGYRRTETGVASATMFRFGYIVEDPYVWDCSEPITAKDNENTVCECLTYDSYYFVVAGVNGSVSVSR